MVSETKKNNGKKIKQTDEHNKSDENLAIANRSRVSCAHNTLRASIGSTITP